MSNEAPVQTIYERATVGETLEPYEYLITQEMFDEYRRVVGNPNAAYPTVAGRHALRAWTNKFGPATLANVGADCEYFNPIIPGKRIRVEAKIADKYIRREKPFVIVDSVSIDEDGRMIEKSRLVGMAAKGDKPLFTEVQKKWEQR